MKKFYCFYLPILFFLFFLSIDRPFPHFMLGMTSSELGLVESLQGLILFYALCMGGYLTISKKVQCSLPLRLLFGSGTLAVLYIFLEEVSFGQHYFNWSTPEHWQNINDQKETNLHNTSSWLDQKPRLLLEIAIFFSGIVAPLIQRYKPHLIPSRLLAILPDKMLFTTAVLSIFPHVYEHLENALGFEDGALFMRTSEVSELYFYYFMLLYFVFSWIKYAPHPRTEEITSTASAKI